MKNKLKIYVWHTPKIIEYINILKKSAQEFDDVEIISVIGNESVDTNLSMGQTSSDSYKNLMLTRWQSLPDIIKQNIGSNIVWLDADCVLNKNNKIFKKTIEQHLENNDFVFQCLISISRFRHFCTNQRSHDKCLSLIWCAN